MAKDLIWTKRDISEHIRPLEVSVFGEGEWQTELYTWGMKVKWKMAFKVSDRNL